MRMRAARHLVIGDLRRGRAVDAEREDRNRRDDDRDHRTLSAHDLADRSHFGLRRHSAACGLPGARQRSAAASSVRLGLDPGLVAPACSTCFQNGARVFR